jgi:hypothetical protein
MTRLSARPSWTRQAMPFVRRATTWRIWAAQSRARVTDSSSRCAAAAKRRRARSASSGRFCSWKTATIQGGELLRRVLADVLHLQLVDPPAVTL